MSVLAKKAPVWSLVLAVGVTAVILTSIIFVGPVLSTELQVFRGFSLAASPSTLTVTQGATAATTNITVTSHGGFSGDVSLTVTVPLDVIGVAGAPSPVHIVPGTGALAIVSVDAVSQTNPGNYTITVTGTSGSLSYSLNLPITVKATNAPEALSLNSYSFPSPANATLYMRDFGSISVTLVSYYVLDSSGNQWARTSWNGPTILPNQSVPAIITIGSSCSGCSYSGASGAFAQFNAGSSYTVTIVTSRNNQFRFTITR